MPATATRLTTAWWWSTSAPPTITPSMPAWVLPPPPPPPADEFDLALRKHLVTQGVVRPGADVTFTIEVINQGQITGTNVQVVDYIPAGMSLSPLASGWSNAGAGKITTTVAAVPLSQTVNIQLVLRIAPTYQGVSLTNFAEIAGASNLDIDIDSTPDDINQNTPGEQPGALEDDQVDEDGYLPGNDEDDHDLAVVAVSQLTDWGDLPQRYPTVAADNGANHRIEPGVYLGAQVDSETDGQPSTGADGDDNNPAPGRTTRMAWSS